MHTEVLLFEYMLQLVSVQFIALCVLDVLEFPMVKTFSGLNFNNHLFDRLLAHRGHAVGHLRRHLTLPSSSV